MVYLSKATYYHPIQYKIDTSNFYYCSELKVIATLRRYIIIENIAVPLKSKKVL